MTSDDRYFLPRVIAAMTTVTKSTTTKAIPIATRIVIA
jgi:hypothetical protein